MEAKPPLSYRSRACVAARRRRCSRGVKRSRSRSSSPSTSAARDPGCNPYPEAFVVQTGTATFTVGDDEHTVAGGHIVVVPAGTPHGFTGAGDDTLRVVSVHPSGTVEQSDL